MTEFTLGRPVHVEFDGVIATNTTSKVFLVNIPETQFCAYVTADHITPLEPANWPPQIGDTWKADDGLYCIRRRPHTGYPVADGIDHYGYFTDMEDFKDLDPELLFRPEQD